MKKLILAIALLIPAVTFSQGYTGDYFRARNYVKSPVFLQNADTISTKAYVNTMYDSLLLHTGSFSRCDPYNVTTINSWLTIKMDTVCGENTTSGFAFNSDSTGIICYFNGVVQISGHAKLLNNSAGSVTASVFIRLKKNGVEVSQFNTAINRVFNANGADDLVSVTGFLNVNYGDELTIEGRTTNANIDIQGVDGGVFDFNPAFSIYLTEINKKYFDFPYLFTSPSLIAFEPSSGTDSLFITSNNDWTITEDLNWISVSPSSGNGNDTVIVSALSNNSTTNRSGIVDIYSLGITRQLSVSQPLIVVDEESLSYNQDGGVKSFNITCETSWTVSENADWIILNKYSGLGDDTINVTVASELQTNLPRSANINITSGTVTVQVVINQIGE